MEKYLTITEKAKDIRGILKKKFGLTSRQVSVKSRNCGYSDAIDLTIKDLNIPVMIDEIKDIANKHESIRYDEFSGEILMGANTYVDVRYDWQKYRDESLKYQDIATNIINSFHPDKNLGVLIAKNKDWELYYYKTLSNTPLSKIWVANKNKKHVYYQRFNGCGKDNYDFSGVDGLSHHLVLLVTIYKLFSLEDFLNSKK